MSCAKHRTFIYLIHSCSQHLQGAVFVWETMPGTADFLRYELDHKSVLMFTVSVQEITVFSWL